MSQDKDPLVECADCTWIGAESELKEIADPLERIESGETMPPGECPACGALAYYVEGENEEHLPPAPASVLEIVRHMVAWNAAAFDGAWFAYQGTVQVGPFATEDAATSYANDQRPGWEVEFREHADVSGGDLVEAFAEWRLELKAALESDSSPVPQVVVTVTGGMVSEVFANAAPDLEVVVLDLDTGYGDEGNAVQVAWQGKASPALIDHPRVQHVAERFLEATSAAPEEEIAPGEFEKAKLSGYDVEPNGFGEGGWYARTPDDDELGPYPGQRAAWEAADAHRRFGDVMPAGYRVRDARMSGYPGPYYVRAPNGRDVAKRETETAAISAAITHAKGETIQYEVMNSGGPGPT